jgi:hypothetical protein
MSKPPLLQVKDREAAVPALLPQGRKARGKIFNRSFLITH